MTAAGVGGAQTRGFEGTRCGGYDSDDASPKAQASHGSAKAEAAAAAAGVTQRMPGYIGTIKAKPGDETEPSSPTATSSPRVWVSKRELEELERIKAAAMKSGGFDIDDGKDNSRETSLTRPSLTRAASTSTSLLATGGSEDGTLDRLDAEILKKGAKINQLTKQIAALDEAAAGSAKRTQQLEEQVTRLSLEIKDLQGAKDQAATAHQIQLKGLTVRVQKITRIAYGLGTLAAIAFAWAFGECLKRRQVAVVTSSESLDPGFSFF